MTLPHSVVRTMVQSRGGVGLQRASILVEKTDGEDRKSMDKEIKQVRAGIVVRGGGWGIFVTRIGTDGISEVTGVGT